MDLYTAKLYHLLDVNEFLSSISMYVVITLCSRVSCYTFYIKQTKSGLQTLLYNVCCLPVVFVVSVVSVVASPTKHSTTGLKKDHISS